MAILLNDCSLLCRGSKPMRRSLKFLIKIKRDRRAFPHNEITVADNRHLPGGIEFIFKVLLFVDAAQQIDNFFLKRNSDLEQKLMNCPAWLGCWIIQVKHKAIM